jgi:curved DNA-binding protein CbpA
VNLYDILGVMPDADADTIKKAYRREAMRHHPDRGGDKARAAAINDAYAVLSDPARREQYDRTGSTAPLQDIKAQARQTLAQLIDEVIESLDRGEDNDVRHNDPITAVRDQLAEHKRQNAAAQRKLERRIAQREEALRRLKHASGEGLLAEALRGAIARLRDEVRKVGQLQALIASVEGLLEGYSYEAEARPEVQEFRLDPGLFRQFQFGL